jgi:hypothetical protein
MTDSLDNQTTDLVDLAGDIVSAYVSNNSTPASELPGLIQSVHAALTRLASGLVETAPEEIHEKPTPAQIRKSVTPGGIVSFLDGRTYKTLKRHHRPWPRSAYLSPALRTSGGLSDGRPGLRCPALGPGEIDRPWPSRGQQRECAAAGQGTWQGRVRPSARKMIAMTYSCGGSPREALFGSRCGFRDSVATSVQERPGRAARRCNRIVSRS